MWLAQCFDRPIDRLVLSNRHRRRILVANAEPRTHVDCCRLIEIDLTSHPSSPTIVTKIILS